LGRLLYRNGIDIVESFHSFFVCIMKRWNNWIKINRLCLIKFML
jgi:hypothetical protein